MSEQSLKSEAGTPANTGEALLVVDNVTLPLAARLQGDHES